MDENAYRDWYFRYSKVFRTRLSQKSKARFLSALLLDLHQLGAAARILQYGSGKTPIQNVYVGDVTQADVVVATYYDTAPYFWGPYFYFDRKKQARQTTRTLLGLSILWLFLGGAITGLLMYFHFFAHWQFLSWKSLAALAIYGPFFALLASFTRGSRFQKNTIRNTSSLLCLLSWIEKNRWGKGVAFAFYDQGVFGDQGLRRVQEEIGPATKLLVLEAIGARAPLFCGDLTNQHIQPLEEAFQNRPAARALRLFAAEKVEPDGYLLSQDLLREEEADRAHFDQAEKWLAQWKKEDAC